MKFDMPKGATVFHGKHEKDSTGKRHVVWKLHTVTEVDDKHRLFLDDNKKPVSFNSVRIESLVFDASGQVVKEKIKLFAAAEMIYSAKPLWWYTALEDRQRAATVLEVYLFQKSEIAFVPYEGWRLFDEVSGTEIFPGRDPSWWSKVKPTVWRAPVRCTRSPNDAIEEYMGPRKEKIAELEKQYAAAKEAARHAGREVTRIRLKLNAAKRIR